MESRIRIGDLSSQQGIRNQLDDFNSFYETPRKAEVITIEILDSDTLVAGAILLDDWGWLKITGLWVAEENRGQGLGKQLISEAEGICKIRSLRGLYVETTSFQSPEFYKQCGFKCFGTVEDMPPGHQSFFYHKYL
jgi:N-acetylglutamate synthase-like GNAT family acetyltransferase